MINNIKKIKLVGAIFVALILGYLSFGSNQALASIPPDSCFNFTGGVIYGYYSYEDNSAVNPACPRNVDIPSTIGGNTVTSIGDGAFALKEITAVTFPNTIASMGMHAFNGNLLTSVTIPSSMTTIPYWAFQNNKLTSVEIPNSITNIEPMAFAYNSLSSIDIPNSVTSIGVGAFYFNKFQSVVIPNSVTTLSAGAFLMNNPDISLYDTVIGGGSVSVLDHWKGINYVQLYTTDPENPNGLTDSIQLESFWGGTADFNNDGDVNDSIGGHIINPASIVLNYKDNNSNTLSPSISVVGDNLNDYFAINNPNNDLSIYYRNGKNLNFTAPAFSGYVTPENYQTTLIAGSNVHNFVYNAIVNLSSESGIKTLVNAGTSTYILLTSGILIIATLSLIFLLTKKRDYLSRY